MSSANIIVQWSRDLPPLRWWVYCAVSLSINFEGERPVQTVWEWFAMVVLCLLAIVISDEKKHKHKVWNHFINNGVTCLLESLCRTIF